MYFVSGRSLNSSRETEFGASRSLADFYQRREQHCSRPAAFKNATVRERPSPAVGDLPGDWQVYLGSGRSLDSSEKAEIGESGHRRSPSRDAREVAAESRAAGP